MKNSEIFWNGIILLVEVLIGLIFFYGDFITFVLTLGVLHSIFLFAHLVDGDLTSDSSFFPAFLFVSFFGGFLLGVGCIMFIIYKFSESRLNPIPWLIDKFEDFNEWLDRNKK